MQNCLVDRTSRLIRSVTSVGFAIFLWAALFGIADAAIAPLEIIQPRAGLNTANRFYKAYPGLVFDVQVAAIGGTFPYSYALVSGPAGLTVNAATGVLKWESPILAGSPHSVSVQVKDATGSTQTVSWTITVTTSGFLFVDSANGKNAGSGGTGTMSNPFRTIQDFYETKYTSTYAGAFVYFRNGTYNCSGIAADGGGFDGNRLALGNNKPLVWLAYPGEAPVIDVSATNISPYVGDISNTYFEGLIFQNLQQKYGVRVAPGANDSTFRRNTFRNLPPGYGGAGSNASGLMFFGNGGLSNRVVVVDNVFRDMFDQGYGILAYFTNNVLVQGNTFSNFNVLDSKAIGPKFNNTNWFIRDNRVNIANGQGVWIDTYGTNGPMELAYNLLQTQKDFALWVGQEASSYGRIESYRNTYVGGGITVSNLANSTGPVTFSNDVIINSSTNVNRIDTPNNSSSPSRLTVQGLLTGAPASGIVDAAGNLSSAYSQYVGQKGYQRGVALSAPLPPADFVAE